MTLEKIEVGNKLIAKFMGYYQPDLSDEDNLEIGYNKNKNK